MIRAFLWGTDPKIVHLSSALPCKFTGVAIVFSRSCATKHSIVKKKLQVIIPFRIFEKFSPKEQTEPLTRQDSFISVIQGPDFANCERK